MTGPAGPGSDGYRDEGSVAWLHALVPGAEELDLLEELDAAREHEQWAERSRLDGFTELLAELLQGERPTLDDVIEMLQRSGHLPAPGSETEPQRAAGGDEDGRSDDPAQGGDSGDDGPATAAVSPGQAAEVIAHLLGGRPVTDTDDHARECGTDGPDDPESGAAADR